MNRDGMLVMTTMVVVMVAEAVLADMITALYRNSGRGSCGDILLKLPMPSVTLCGIVCSQEAQCGGFSFQGHDQDSSYCQLHQNITSPNGDDDTTCYLPVTRTTTTTPETTTHTQETTDSQPPDETTTASATTLVPTTTIATTTASATTLVPTTTIATTATTIMTTVQAARLTNTEKVNIDEKKKCPSNGAAIGIYQASSYFLICKYAPNDLNFNVGEPEDQCDSPTRQIRCMNVQCGQDSLIMGFRQASHPSQGPCSNGFNGNGVTMIDQTDCHTVSGLMQATPDKDATWSQWRICGGNGNDLYVMTGAEVNKAANGIWTIDTITCCRIRRD